VAQADTEERSTGALTAAVDVAAWCARAAVAVSGASLVVVVAPQTNLKLAGSCDLDVKTTNVNFKHVVTSNKVELVHWPLMGELLHLVKGGGYWAGPQPTQPLLTVPNVTAHPSTANVPTSYYSMYRYNCLCSLKG